MIRGKEVLGVGKQMSNRDLSADGLDELFRSTVQQGRSCVSTKTIDFSKSNITRRRGVDMNNNDTPQFVVFDVRIGTTKKITSA